MASRFRARRVAPGRQQRRRWLAGTTAAVLAGATALALSAAPASAAPTPKYSSTDTATFSALGVTDSNCFLGVGGDEIWVKPGDKIDFESRLLGLNLDNLHLSALTKLLGSLLGPLLGDVSKVKIAGLHVAVTIDKGTKGAQAFTVDSTGTTHFPDATKGLRALSGGDHTLDWTVDSISLLPTLQTILGPIAGKLTTISLTQALGVGAKLDAGAKLNWHGTIHVTDNAPNCALPAVSVPGVEIDAGNTKVSTPQINVNPNETTTGGLIGVQTPPGSTTPPGTHTTPPSNSHSTAPGNSGYTAPGETVPERVVPKGYGNDTAGGSGSGGFGNAYPDGGGLLFGPAGPQSGPNGTVPSGAAPDQQHGTKTARTAGQNESTLNLAANEPPSQRMPVLLAILAILALSLVTATYARLYLLRRNA